MLVANKSLITTSSFWSKPEEEIEALVKREAKIIKENFTAEEIDKLELDIIDGDSPSRCIYGTMVGTCNSERVLNFIKNNIDLLIRSTVTKPFESFDDVDVSIRSYDYFVTPLEEYIMVQNDFDDIRLDDEDPVPDSVKERIEQVINWIKE